jgi:hypothetical protein
MIVRAKFDLHKQNSYNIIQQKTRRFKRDDSAEFALYPTCKTGTFFNKTKFKIIGN